MTNALTVIDGATGEIVQRDEGLAAPLADLVERMKLYQEVCKQLLEPSDYQVVGGKAFKKKSAFRKLALAYGVTTQIIARDIAYDDEGRIHHADFTVRAIARNGRAIDSYGGASVVDRDFSHDQDVAATAETRATSRAIANLLGTGEVSAEEIGREAPQRPRQQQPRKADLVQQAQQAQPAGPRGTQRVEGTVVKIAGSIDEPVIGIENKEGKRKEFLVSAMVPEDLVPTADHIGAAITAWATAATSEKDAEIVQVAKLEQPPAAEQAQGSLV